MFDNCYDLDLTVSSDDVLRKIPEYIRELANLHMRHNNDDVMNSSFWKVKVHVNTLKF